MKWRTLKIIPEKPVSKLDRLEPHNTINGNPEDLVSIRWDGEWNKNIDP